MLDALWTRWSELRARGKQDAEPARTLPEGAVSPALALEGMLKPTTQLALFSVLLCLGGFVMWSWLTPIASATIAQGVVSPDTSRKTIQHLEGGIVREVLVKEGDEVSEGQVLARLESTQARANYSSRREQWLRLTAIRARLEAHEAGEQEMKLPEIASEKDNEEFKQFLESQKKAFEIRIRILEERDAIASQQIKQLREEVNARELENAGLLEQQKLIEQEIREKSSLIDKRLIKTADYYAVVRQGAATRAKIGSNLAEIARSLQRIEEVRMQTNSGRSQHRDQNAQELTKVNSDIAQLEEAMSATGDILRRTEIRAPVAGTVLNIRAKTIGGVLRGGDALLDIIPKNDDLIIDARMSPVDINQVQSGMPARVQFAAYSSKYVPMLEGSVLNVAADSLSDQQSGQRYVPVRVKIDRQQLSKLTIPVRLTAGMPADVFIVTNERSFLQYLAEPIMRSFRRAFREA